MRTIRALLGLFLLFASVGFHAQSKKPAVSKPAVSPATAKKPAVPDAPKQNLGDDFAKAGLKALRAIEGTLDMLGFDSGKTQELVDNADAEARTAEELAVVKALNSFNFGRLRNNLKRKVLTEPSYNADSALKAQAELEKNPINIDMNSREAACSHVLDDILRARHYTEKPSACYEVIPPEGTTR